MNWHLITSLAVLGIVMGLLSIRGLTQNIEIYLWLLFATATVVVLYKNADQKYFLHALCIGILWGMLNSIIQSSFFEMYLKYNPNVVEGFQKSPINPRILVLLVGPVIGAITGTVMGLVMVIVKKFIL